MLLLDEVIAGHGDGMTGVVRITPASAFYRASVGVPAYVGVEYMAQAIAAYDGWKRLRNGYQPAPGFLLGTRHYHSTSDYFVDGDVLYIVVISLFSADGMAAFECTMELNGVVCAKATLNVYRPDPEAVSITESVS